MSLKLVDSRLLKVLLKINLKEFNKLEEVSEFMNLSTRTIQNYIKKLNEIMGGVAKIINVKGLGYKLIVEDKSKFTELTEYSSSEKNSFLKLNTSEDRWMYIAQLLVDSNEIITIDELAYKINVGRTTLVNDLKKVKVLFKIYDIKLNAKQNLGIKVSGDELNIRFLILDYFCKGFNSNIKYYENCELIKKIRDNLINIFSINKFHITDKTIAQLMNYIVVMIDRLKQDKFIKQMSKKYYRIKQTNEYSIAFMIKSMLEKILKNKLNDYEVIFLTLPLLGREAPVNLANVKVDSNVRQLVEQIIDEVNDKFGLSIKLDGDIVKNLEYHLNFMINRLIFNINIKNTLLQDIKRSYPLAYEMAKAAGKIIEQKYNLITKEDELGYIALYFESYIEQNSKNNHINVKKVALVCGTGLGTAQLLKIKLSKMLTDKDTEINTFSDINLNKKILDEYDIIFTTVDLKINTDTPIVKVNALFNEEYLSKELDKRLSLKKSNIKYVEDNLSILSIIIQKQFFFLLNKSGYFDNLNEMMVKISTNPDVDEDFKERVIKRELQNATFLGNYIALPHAVNKKGKRLSISVGILEEPIVCNGSEIRIIILLIIPTEDKIDSEILIKAYEELLKLGRNKKVIEKISKIRDYDEFKNILLKEVNL